MHKERHFIYLMITLTMMSMMGLLASDIYIPGLHGLTLSLQATVHQVQLTIGLYLLGLAIFQLIYGPLSDHFGRKPILLFGFVTYTVASLLCTQVTTIEHLIILRFIQSCGACSGLVVGRAVIADLFDHNEAPKIYNIIYPLVAASPAIAPWIGGYLITWFGWPSTFLFVGIFGILLIIMTMIHLQESKKAEERTDLDAITTLNNYKIVISNRYFWAYVAPVFTLYGSWFVFLTQSTFTYTYLGYDTKTIGYFYIPLALSIYIGNLFCKFFLKRISKEQVFRIGLACFFLGAMSLFLMTQFATIDHAWKLIVPMCLVAFTNGIILPIGIAVAIGLKPTISGSASGMVGFCQIGFSSLCASFFGTWFGIASSAMATEILVLSIIALFFNELLRNKAHPSHH